MEWKTWAPSDVVKELAKNNRVRDSRLFQEIKTFLNDGGSDNDNRDENGSPTGVAESSLTRILGELTVMRTVTLTVLFFLVHLLVRLYQYSLRLASFWESRSDAVLLAQSFATDKAKVFDDLVRALAPDAYDFKSYAEVNARLAMAPAESLNENSLVVRIEYHMHPNVRWSWFVVQEGGRNKVYSAVIDHAAKVVFNPSRCFG